MFKRVTDFLLRRASKKATRVFARYRSPKSNVRRRI